MIENHSAKMFKNSELLQRPEMNYGVSATKIDGQDPAFHYAFMRCDNGARVPMHYAIVDTNETGEKPIGYSDGLRTEDGHVYFHDTVLCRLPMEKFNEREAARQYRRQRILKTTQRKNEKVLREGPGTEHVQVSSSLELEKRA